MSAVHSALGAGAGKGLPLTIAMASPSNAVAAAFELASRNNDSAIMHPFFKCNIGITPRPADYFDCSARRGARSAAPTGESLPPCKKGDPLAGLKAAGSKCRPID